MTKIIPEPFRIVIENRHTETRAYAQVLWDWLLPVSFEKATAFTNRNEAQATALVLGRRIGAKVQTDIEVAYPGNAPLADLPFFVYITQERLPGLDMYDMRMSLDNEGALPIELLYANHGHAEWTLSPNLAWQVEQEKARFDQRNDF